jgi:hypothetical protein
MLTQEKVHRRNTGRAQLSLKEEIHRAEFTWWQYWTEPRIQSKVTWWQYCEEQSIQSRVYMVAVLYNAEYTEHSGQGGSTGQSLAYRAGSHGGSTVKSKAYEQSLHGGSTVQIRVTWWQHCTDQG